MKENTALPRKSSELSVHWPTSLSLGDLKEILGCVGRVLADSNRLDDILLAEELTAGAQLKFLLRSGVMATGEGPDIMSERPRFSDVDMKALAQKDEGTFGRAVADFFKLHGLESSLYDVECVHTPDSDAAYLLQRLRTSHDLWHVLMSFNVDGHEEILLHAFSLAQSGMPASVVLMVLGSLKHMVLEARWGCMRSGLHEAYRRGRFAVPLLPVYWERHLDTPLDVLRRELRILPWSEEDRAGTERWNLSGPHRLTSRAEA